MWQDLQDEGYLDPTPGGGPRRPRVSLESLDSGTISGFPTTFEADLTERIHNIHASRGRVVNEEGKWDYPWPSYSRIFSRLQSPMRCAYGH